MKNILSFLFIEYMLLNKFGWIRLFGIGICYKHKSLGLTYSQRYKYSKYIQVFNYIFVYLPKLKVASQQLNTWDLQLTNKILTVIYSCTTLQHIETTRIYLDLYYDTYKNATKYGEFMCMLQSKKRSICYIQKYGRVNRIPIL